MKSLKSTFGVLAAGLVLASGCERQYTESVEPQTGLIKLLVDTKGEALAITGNGDGTTSTNYFGNIHDTALMDYISGEKVSTTFIDSLPKYGEQK